MSQQAELDIKLQRIRGYMKRSDLDAIALTRRANFSWLSCGGTNHVNAASETGVASLVVTDDTVYCVTNTIEAGRIADEELAGMDVEMVVVPWHDASASQRAWAEVLGSRRCACDVHPGGMDEQVLLLGKDFDHLRAPLTDPEIERYRELGQRASMVMEQVGHTVEPGTTEAEIAAQLSRRMWDHGTRPWVILIAADDRLRKFRHPVVTDTRADKIVMIVVCAERYGLLCSLTRIISFVPIDDDLRRRHEACTTVDAAMISGSTPGRTIGEVLADAQKVYSEYGFADEWQLHHQGGPTGYSPRDCVATPGNPMTITSNQALAWNPSITGTKSEDTIIATDLGPLLMSCPVDWPTVQATWQGKSVTRADILER